MAPKGLPDVIQRFIADAEQYLETLATIIERNKQYIQVVEDARKKYEQLESTLNRGSSSQRALASEVEDAKREMEDLTRSVRENINYAEAQTNVYRDVIAALRSMREETVSTGRAVRDVNEEMAALKTEMGNAVGAVKGTAKQMADLDYQIRQTGAHAEATASAISSNFLRQEEQVGRLARGWEKARQAQHDYFVEAAYQDFFGGGGGQYPPGARGGDTARQLMDAFEALGGYAGVRARGDAGVRIPRDPGFGPALASIIAGAGGALGAAGSFIGGPPANFGSYFTGGGRGGEHQAGTAIAAFANVAAAIGRVYPAIHWAIMLGNELLATAGPAAVGLGMAGLVGMQGGQQVAGRASSIFRVMEALGPTSGGQSFATALGMPNTLQQFQNMYGSGEVYGIAGAGINASRITGGGSAFLGLGQRTLSMISGAAANFVLALQHGLGTAAGAIVAGGAGYAQSFGNILGNVGKTFLSAGPNLPGVGSMILQLAKSATGGLADFTSAIGPGLMPILGFEAGSRWGPSIVGGAASLLAGLPGGIGGTASRAARIATAKDVLANRAAIVGEKIPAVEGTGLAGILGGMSAAEIGGLAVVALAIGKTLTAQTGAQQRYGGIAGNLSLGPTIGGYTNIVQGLSTLASAAYGGGGAGAFPSRQQWSLYGPLNMPGGRFAPLSDQALGSGLPQIGKAFQDQMVQGGKAIGDLFTGQWSKALHEVGSMWQDVISPGGILHGFGQMLGIVPPAPSDQQAAMDNLKKAFSTWSNVLGAPGQVKGLWAGAGGGKLGTADALNVLMQAGVDINTGFGKNNLLTAKAAQQVKDYISGIQAMTGTVPGGASGGMLAAINAQTVARGISSSQLASTNAAYDQITQIAQGGAGGSAALKTLLSGVGVSIAAALAPPAPGTPAPASLKDIQKALASGPLTKAGAAAFTAFDSTTQASVMSQLSAQADWGRTEQVIGAFGGGGSTQANMMKYWIGQAFNQAKGSPLAMAALSTVAQQYGMAPLSAGMSTHQMDQAFKSFLQGGDTAKQYVRDLTKTTVAGASIPADAKTFVTLATGGMTQGLATGIDKYGADTQSAFMTMIGKGGMPTPANARQLAGLLSASGYSTQSAAAMAAAAAKFAGGTDAQIAAAAKSVTLDINAKLHLDTSGAAAAAGKSVQSGIDAAMSIHKTKGLAAAIGHLPDLSVAIKEHLQKTAIPKPSDVHASIIYKNVVPHPPGAPTVYGSIIYTVSIAGMGSVRTVSPGGSVGSLGGHTGQHGMLVPGFGSGDIVPAMLEPGELVVPRNMVSAGMVSHLKGKIPGYASGGIVGIPEMGGLTGFELSTVGAIGGLAHSVNALTQAIMSGGFSTPVMKIFAAGAKGQQSDTFWGQFGRQIMLGLIEGIKNAKGETKQAAQALVNSVTQEVAYGKNIAAAAKQGLGYNPWGGGQTLLGTFGNLAVPQMTSMGTPYQYYIDQAAAGAPGAAPQSVQQQMGDYLQAMKSFKGDIGKLQKAGLNKNLMQQIIAAGPLAGDQLAQSILGGAGGVKGANSLWSQINQTANQLGVTGASAVAGTGGKSVGVGVVANAAPVHSLQAAINALHGKTVTVRVNVVTGGGGGGGGGGLTKSQMKSVVEGVQSHLLVQAKNNRHTGIMLPGYGA